VWCVCVCVCFIRQQEIEETITRKKMILFSFKSILPPLHLLFASCPDPCPPPTTSFLSSLPGTTTVTGIPVQDGHLPRKTLLSYTHTHTHTNCVIIRITTPETHTHTHTNDNLYLVFQFLFKISNTYFTLKHLTPFYNLYYKRFSSLFFLVGFRK
jgi:hypothetical protein